jgi:hypothetical protein
MQNVTVNDAAAVAEAARAAKALLLARIQAPPARFTDDELSNDEYHAAPGISKSHLDVIADSSPRHYWQAYLNPAAPIREPTEALHMGRAIHTAVLQPELLERDYVEWCGADKRTREGKALWAEFQQAQGDRLQISANEMEICRRIRESFGKHPVAKGFLVRGKAENSFFARHAETGALIKCRPDYITDDGEIVVDVKTTADANPLAFGRDATNYRYDVAVPWYFDIIEAVTGRAPKKWIWLAVEKTPPYAVGIYYARTRDIVRARDTARRNLLQILHHRQLGAWPDYGDVVRPLELSPWIKR